ncbi:hypothetical protein ABL78_3956 [Leptomonas seymouri]|uniref:Uncharacterized protein n=1 Tax=Leptomonas seymouri TaxID=5684 RepID=A0A0N1HX89_LEPSE|nr:hypothetical protein ABL78_3956 [Leptomonas seymouri]|eukprot:KPI86965.1 hypothetical protein ABL78_3956 [Leptomonas seymouri]
MSKHLSNPLSGEAQRRTSSPKHPPRGSPTIEARSTGTMKHISSYNKSTAAAPRRMYAHHFPLFSHPMFRAAIHNSNAARSALEAQVEQVDRVALDNAVDSMVEELLRQQAAARAGGAEESESPVVSEEQLLALLASASRTPAPSGAPQALGSTLPKLEHEQPLASFPIPKETLSQLPAETFAAPAGLLLRPLPPSTRHHLTSRSPPPAPPSGADAPHEADEMHVVSVLDLQRAAVAYTRRMSQGDAPQHALSSFDGSLATPYASHLSHGPSAFSEISQAGLPLPCRASSTSAQLSVSEGGPTVVPFGASLKPTLEQGSAAATRTRAKPAKRAHLYSLLPTHLGSNSGNSASEGGSGLQIASGTPSHGITFAEMDRRPGIGAGPVAQQSVDKAHLQNMSDSVFAAMDVLMDGNSCCVRRRRRAPGQATSCSAPSATFSLKKTNACPLTSFTYSMSDPVPIPPPRTAAEAKARRILEAQRRRRRQQSTPPGVVAEISAGQEAMDASRQATTLHAFPSRSPVPTTVSNASIQTAPLPPLYTMRHMASRSLLAQAVESVHNYNAPRKRG